MRSDHHHKHSNTLIYILIAGVLILLSLQVSVYMMINVEQLEIYVDQTTEPVLVESEPLVTQMDRKSFLINACRPNYMSEFKHLEYLRREMTKNCPDRLISFNEFGRLNNNILELIRMLSMGISLNRTVVILDTFASGFPAKHRSSLQKNFCIIEENDVSFSRLKTELKYGDIYSWQWGDAWTTDLFGVETIQIEMNTTEARYGLSYPRALCLARDMKPDNIKLFHVPNVFYTELGDDIFKGVLSFFEFHPDIIKRGDAFIEKVLKNKAFIGVHMRGFEGKCLSDVNKLYAKFSSDAALEEARWMCDITMSRLETILRRRGFSTDYMIFLASDGQNIKAERDLISSNKVVKYKLTEDDDDDHIDTIDMTMIDMYILKKSQYFMGLQRSTLAYNIAKIRENRGLSTERNILPGYNGGNQEELFLSAV